MLNSYWYAYGYKNKNAALKAIEDSYAIGDICPGEKPFIKRYMTDRGETRYGIKCVSDYS